MSGQPMANLLRLTCLYILVIFSMPGIADQYRSQELQAPAMNPAQEKTIDELEKSLKGLQDHYSKASTARYLARYYSTNDVNKAEMYFQTALEGDGLSDYAKQDVLAELAQVYMRQKNYPALLKALEQRRRLGGKDSNELLVMQALAASQTQQYTLAISSADAVLVAEKHPDEVMLQQLLFVYFNSKAYAKAAQMQQACLQFRPDDIAGWRQLAGIYLKLDDKGKAADALSVAYQKQLPLSEQDVYLLVELYARNGNPYGAARLLEQAMQKQQVPATIDYQEKLFSYWMMAKERQQAIMALQKAAKMQPTIDRYLQLAQLQMEVQDWQAMKNSVASACMQPLPDVSVSYANLLLGVSELKLNHYAVARRAFINAAIMGGENDAAQQYLRYMNAEPASEDELSAFEGDCTPAWAKTTAAQLAVPAMTSDEKAVGALAYNIKTSAPQALVVGNVTMAVAEMEQKMLPLVMRMATYIVKNRGTINGNLHFIFPKPVAPDAEVLHFQLAFPVSREPGLLGHYRMLQDKGYKSASAVFRGAPEQLPAYWKRLYDSVIADGLKPTGSGRQIVLEPQSASREFIQMELQLGIE